MKLFIITSRIPFPLEKGDKLRIYHQIKAMSKSHEIYLCSLYFNNIDKDAYTNLSKYCKEVHFIKLSIPKILVSCFKSIFNGVPFQTALFTDSSAKRRVRTLLQKIQPHHIYCQLTRVAEYVCHEEYSKTLDYMDAFSKGMERRAEQTSWLTSWFFKWESLKQSRYEEYIYTYFNSHCIITEEDRKHILNSDKNKIYIVPNGVDFKFFTPQKNTNLYDIVFVGNMSYAPNIDAATFLCNELLPIIKKGIPSVKIHIAGANPSNAVLKLASNHVTVSGWIPDIREAYASSTIVIAPMRIGTGLQNKLLEAMAMKKACITTSLANKALNAPNDSILIGNSAQELAKHCIDLLQNPDLISQIATNGNVFVHQTFQWKKTTETLHDLFLE